MSATRPAIELSIGIIARSASPPSTAAKTSSNDAQAQRLPVGVVLLADQVGVGAGLALVGDPASRHRGDAGTHARQCHMSADVRRLGSFSVWILDVVALVVALAAAALAVVALRRQTATGDAGADALPEDVHGLRQEVAALRVESGDALRHLAVVRYDAFGDMGGHLSWSLALLDDSGNGVVLTSIHGRNDARTYAKSIASWTCEQQLSPEEDEAIAHARP